MTVQEKSKELVWKYYHNIEHTISDEYSDKDWEIAKQCSIIAVDYLMKESKTMTSLDYWFNVKTEIQKL
jgi:hypothetical protein